MRASRPLTGSLTQGQAATSRRWLFTLSPPSSSLVPAQFSLSAVQRCLQLVSCSQRAAHCHKPATSCRQQPTLWLCQPCRHRLLALLRGRVRPTLSSSGQLLRAPRVWSLPPAFPRSLPRRRMQAWWPQALSPCGSPPPRHPVAWAHCMLERGLRTLHHKGARCSLPPQTPELLRAAMLGANTPARRLFLSTFPACERSGVLAARLADQSTPELRRAERPEPRGMHGNLFALGAQSRSNISGGTLVRPWPMCAKRREVLARALGLQSEN
mmetsp:Transcript_75687/g.244911  ORF Transcript_75687/g.244911 Transcript_75687/m.244911 type:complete len:269 (+) Transcript_75687:153-959(+)